MWETIKEYVLSYDIYSHSKNPQYQPYGLLQPLLEPKRPWSSISMDFMVDLPREKLVRERGAGSGEQGARISSSNFLKF